MHSLRAIFASVNGPLQHGESHSKLVHFKEQYNIFCTKKAKLRATFATMHQ
jgi:hypothetical protein